MILLDLTNHIDLWPEELAPVGAGTREKEPFENWWQRCEARLAHLHPKIAEQWIYRHWKNSPFIGLDLAGLTWCLEKWVAAEILKSVVLAYGPLELDPERDYRTFTKVYSGMGPGPTRLDLDTGTWDFPIVVLHTPEGFISEKGDFPEARYVLVEGHQRFMYFNALYNRGEIAGEHSIFILEQSGRKR